MHHSLANGGKLMLNARIYATVCVCCVLINFVGGSFVFARQAAEGEKDKVSVSTKRVERNILTANELLAKSKFAEAADLYRQTLSSNPENVAAIVGLGKALSGQFKLDGADAEFEKALSIDHDNPSARAGKALVLLKRLQSSSFTVLKSKEAILKQAEDECNLALIKGPKLAECHYVLGLIYKEQGKLNEAAKELNEAIALDAGFSDAYAASAMVEIIKGNLLIAKELSSKAISINSSNSTAHYALGRIFLRGGKPDEAISELNTALYLTANCAPCHEALGAAYEMQGNTVAAIKEYEESIRIKPENPLCFVRIAEIRQQRGDLEHSIAELRAGLELMPENCDLHLWIANQSLRANKVEDALIEYFSAIKIEPDNEAAAEGLARALYLRAQSMGSQAYFASNDFKRAEEAIGEAVKLRPNDLLLALAQAKLRVLAGGAIELKDIGIPTNDGERIASAEVLLAQDRFKESERQLKAVLESTSNLSQTLALGDLALMLKELNLAQAAYKKALSINPNDERAKRGMQLVENARKTAQKSFDLGSDFAQRKQEASAINKFYEAVSEDPMVAEFHLALARQLDKTKAPTPSTFGQAARQYRAYIELSSDVQPKELKKLKKHIEKLATMANKSK